MKEYIFYWKDGETSKGKGSDVADAFSKLGYSAGAINALDYYEEV